MVIWYIFPRFGMLYYEKSGNPVPQSHVEKGKKISRTTFPRRRRSKKKVVKIVDFFPRISL
jgi:hypothetical protein